MTMDDIERLVAEYAWRRDARPQTLRPGRDYTVWRMAEESGTSANCATAGTSPPPRPPAASASRSSNVATRLDRAVGMLRRVPLIPTGTAVNDAGGCKEALSRGFSVDGHRMELYELDGAGRAGRAVSKDTRVETLLFPSLTIDAGSLNCSADYCGKSKVGGWRSPPTRASGS